MKKLFLSILFSLAICSQAIGAEILIMGKNCATGSYSQTDIVSVGEDGSYERSTGYTFPTFVLVKLPGVPESEVKYLEEPLMVQDGVDEFGYPKMKVKQIRKHHIPASYFKALSMAKKNSAKVSENVISTFIKNIEEKTE